jgi:ABC-type multidrug transport system ATPase subunit
MISNPKSQGSVFAVEGEPGTGKTTLARILIGKYSKNKPYLELNSSFYTSIETLRTKVDEFCSKVYMGLDLTDDLRVDDIKYVFHNTKFEKNKNETYKKIL